ncbi:MAG: recombination protein RecR [Bacteroidia bacterium]|nr:recombination protein RecR [Bacteroidia bacterium]MBP7262024.1 recombination protein RecR [Bacteroidia bacterium]MBP9180655.1 recombination protein RecR [Bacteroidia bacterium]MBP9724889.1 recombination protein RecR [Bacteroidia bacterium]
MNFPSHLIEQAVNELARFPGVGKKSALRMVLFLLRQSPDEVSRLSSSLSTLRNEIKFCSRCNNVSDENICRICNSVNRNKKILCVVEDLRDVMAIENTGQFNGLYYVLGGLISPMDGIGPEALNIDKLLTRIAEENIEELLIALSATMEGDTTTFYLSKRLRESPVKLTTISRGIAVGGELEYADEVTLGRSIMNRIPYSG